MKKDKQDEGGTSRRPYVKPTMVVNTLVAGTVPCRANLAQCPAASQIRKTPPDVDACRIGF